MKSKQSWANECSNGVYSKAWMPRSPTGYSHGRPTSRALVTQNTRQGDCHFLSAGLSEPDELFSVVEELLPALSGLLSVEEDAPLPLPPELLEDDFFA